MSTEIDGFIVGERIHSGAMGDIFRVTGRHAGVPMIMKLPRIEPGDSAESLISFETEASILPALSGPHVPRAGRICHRAAPPAASGAVV